MMGEEGKPGKKIKVKGRVKRPDRPPENPVVDVSLQMFTDREFTKHVVSSAFSRELCFLVGTSSETSFRAHETPKLPFKTQTEDICGGFSVFKRGVFHSTCSLAENRDRFINIIYIIHKTIGFHS